MGTFSRGILFPRVRTFAILGGMLPLAIAVVAWEVRGESKFAAPDIRTPADDAMKSDTWQPLQSKQPRTLPSLTPIGSGRFDKQNAEVVPPRGPWFNVDTGVRAPNVCLSMVRSNPNILLMLVAEAAGIEMNPDSELLVKFAKARLLAISSRTVFTNEKEETVGGIHGRTFEASMLSPEGSQYWLIWVGARNGFIYEIALMGSPFNAEEIGEASRDFRRGFKQIDPKRIAHRPPSEILTKYKSKAFGYDIDLTGLGWVKMRGAVAQMPSAEICAQTATGSGLVVLAVPMPNRAPDMDLLAKAVIASTGLENNGTEIVRTTPYTYGDLQCREIETVRAVEGKKVFGRMRLIADDRCAYAIFGWSLSEYKDDAARVRKSLDQFGVHPRQPVITANLTSAQSESCATVLNEIGMRYYTKGDLVASLDFFRISMRMAPARDACVCNYLEVLGKLDRHDEALRFLDEHKSTYGSNLRFRVLRARLLTQKGDIGGARKAFGELIDDGYVDSALLVAYVDVAVTTKAYDEAIGRIAKVMEKRPTLQNKRLQAGLYALKGDHEKAIKTFEQLRIDYPDDLGVAVDLATAYERAEKFDSAIAVTQKLVDAGKEDEALLLVHGRLLLHLGRGAEGKRAFERARELYPNSEHVNDMLKIASSQLGEGENSCLKKAIEPVATPAEVTKAIERAEQGRASTAHDGDAEELVHIVGLNFKPGERIRKTTTQRVKVYSANGVTRYGMLTYKMNPVGERLYVNRLVVSDEHGKQIATGSVDNYFMSDESSNEASNLRTVKIPVPGLKPGYTLECTVTREILGAATDLPFQEISLACEAQARVSAFFVSGDVKQLKCKTSDGLKIRSATDLLYAVEPNVAPVRYEPHQPAVETFSPVVWMGPANTTWADEARTYLKLVQDKLVLDESTKALAVEITQGCKTKRDKLAAIAQHVQQGYTYHAIEFGRRARIPNSAPKTVTLKYGDCKDHALLTRQLLAAAGIRAHLTLVRSTGDIVSDIPALDQFDHVVVFVPGSEIEGVENAMGGLVVDTTNKDADPLLDTPYGLEDRSVLVLDPANPRLVRTPKYPAEGGKLSSRRKLSFEISPSGSVECRVTEDVTLNEYLSPGMRAFFRHFDAAARREALQGVLSDNGPIRIKRIQPVNLQAVREPLRIEMEYAVPNGFRLTNSSVSGKSLVGSLPCVWETQYAAASAVDARQTPFEIGMPKVIQSSLTFTVPDGYSFSDLAQCNGAGKSRFRSWSSRASQDGETVTIDYEVHLAAGRHSAEEYEQYYTDSNDSLAVLRAPLTISSSGVSETASRPTDQSGKR